MESARCLVLVPCLTICWKQFGSVVFDLFRDVYVCIVRVDVLFVVVRVASVLCCRGFNVRVLLLVCSCVLFVCDCCIDNA